MPKVRTFARTFLAGHPRHREKTFFVEKIWKGLWDAEESSINTLRDYQPAYDEFFYPMGEGVSGIHQFTPKITTIRAGKHFKNGDYFSPRVWKGAPYNSKTIRIAPDLKLENVYDFKIEIDKDYICVLIEGYPYYEENSKLATQVDALNTLALNDGLSVQDFKSWFKWGKAPFDGQILSWTKKLCYTT